MSEVKIYMHREPIVYEGITPNHAPAWDDFAVVKFDAYNTLKKELSLKDAKVAELKERCKKLGIQQAQLEKNIGELERQLLVLKHWDEK